MSGARKQMKQIADGLESFLEYRKEEGVGHVEADPDTVRELGAGPPSPAAPPPSPGSASDQLQAIAERIAACTTCELCDSRTKTVPGQGPLHPEIAFVGEGPGADEDRQGLAFVGRSGQLLTRMITRMGFSRDDVWIGNIVKCRPPGNRTPYPDEMDTCIPYLKEQLAILKPKVIVCLGATAVKGLLKARTGITKLRGTWMEFEGIPVMPTYHPSYLLRSGGEGNQRYWEVWEDLEAVLAKLGRKAPPKESGDRNQGTGDR